VIKRWKPKEVSKIQRDPWPSRRTVSLKAAGGRRGRARSDTIRYDLASSHTSEVDAYPVAETIRAFP